MKKPHLYSNTYQLKLPLEISTIIDISDSVYTFCEIIDKIDLNKYNAPKERKFGRPRFDQEILLKVILFAFMENGYVSTREIEKLCRTDIRFMWLLQDNPPPSHMTIDNFMKDTLTVLECAIFRRNPQKELFTRKKSFCQTKNPKIRRIIGFWDFDLELFLQPLKDGMNYGMD